MSFLDEFISRRSIRTLTTLLIVCVTIPALAVIFALGLHLFQDKQAEVRDQSMELAQASAMYHQGAIRQAQTLLETIADVPALKQQSASEISEFFKKVVASNPQYANITLVRPDGFLYASSASMDTSVNYSGRASFQQAVGQRRFVVGQAIQSWLSNLPVLPFAAPVIGPNGQITGVLQLGLKIDAYEKYFSALKVPSGTRFLLFDSQGTRLFRYPQEDSSPWGQKISPWIWEAISKSNEASKTFQLVDKAGLPITYSYIKMADEEGKRSELGILVGIPTPSFARQVWPVIGWTLFSVGFIAVCAMAIGYFLSNKILITGLVALEAKTSEIIRSKQLIPVEAVPGCREVHALAESFNRLVGFLRLDKKARDKAERAQNDAVTRFQTFLETASDAVHILDPEGNLIECSHSFLHMLGYSKDEAAGLNLKDWIVHIPEHELIETINALMLTPRTFETKHRRKDGAILDVEISAKGMELGGRPYLYASARDITWRRQAEDAMRQSEEKYRVLFENAPMGIYRSTMSGRLVTANSAQAQIHGFASPREFVDYAAPGTQVLFADVSQHAELRRILLEQGEVKAFESQRKRKDGTLVWVATTAHLIRDPAFDEPIIEGFVRDITERKRAQEELTRLATTDPLTGASNRRRFYTRGAEEFARSQRHGLGLAMLLMDIDHFKAVNDTHGHNAGDAVLTAMVAKCMEILRAEDLFARLGGEEFAALLVHTGVEGAHNTAMRLLKALGALEIAWEDKVIRFTVSIGVAVLRPDDVSIKDIIQRADNALYQAKDAGRDRVRLALTM